jgi:hypothetical protein
LIVWNFEKYSVATSNCSSDAEKNAAPEAWAHIAIGLMLKELGAAVGDDYRCGVIDSAYRDPEV